MKQINFFTKKRKISYSISGILFLLSLITIFFLPLQTGIEMTGGFQLEYSVDHEATRENLDMYEKELQETYLFDGKKVLSEISIYMLTAQNTLRAELAIESNFTSEEIESIQDSMPEKIQNFLQEKNIQASNTSFIVIGKTFGDYIKQSASFSLFLSIIFITLYIIFVFGTNIQEKSLLSVLGFLGVIIGISAKNTFIYLILIVILILFMLKSAYGEKDEKNINSSHFWIITILTLTHDVVIVSGIYIFMGLLFPELKIDTFFVTALLTILGYSINDTIVILDRVRENMIERKKKKMSLTEIIEKSIQSVLRRSIYTSLTLIFVLISMFFFGPDSLRSFILILILGSFIGTYSSVMISAPLIIDLGRKK